MEKFTTLWQRACERKGSEQVLNNLLSQPRSKNQLQQLTDDRYLSEFSKKIFQSGFVWRVVENKWPNFETLFFNFEIQKVLMLSPEMLDNKASDARIIRNAKKVQAIYQNALMIHDIQVETNDAFASWISQWPEEDTIGLWLYFKKHGTRLGGNTGPYALRALGYDTFLLTRDVEAYFRNYKLIDGGLTSLKSLKVFQSCFNQWREESGLSLQEISQVIAYGTGDNNLGFEN
ncbi:DNA-3-methyladenine glycosylase I [Catenovulum maritimum]|uniref:3-methyladenine DNA glycosylase n=1 Tax=Catenovulum maritimum TaxID=1513271 RepID=A0A0J8GYA5_9ALTE|nr:DNA-3-methyladenine glycosylase I [Catenovulum maritimum]KMT66219.1 hypothetical protein XM47_04265 [Catenovulum maritimum]